MSETPDNSAEVDETIDDLQLDESETLDGVEYDGPEGDLDAVETSDEQIDPDPDDLEWLDYDIDELDEDDS